jgi:hypothetical protein
LTQSEIKLHSVPAVQAHNLKKAATALTFVTPEEISQYVNVLIVGPQGSGKTLLATSILEDNRVEGVLILAVEKNGVKSGVDYLRAHRNKANIVYVGYKKDENGDLIPIDIFKHMNEIIRYARVATNRTTAEEAGYPYIDTIVIDSISSLADKVLDKISGVSVSIEAGNVPRGAQIQEYGTQKSIIENWLNAFLDMSCHVIVTCLEHMAENQVTKVKERQPHLPAKMAEKVPSMVDGVLCLEVDKQSVPHADGTLPRTLYCQADKRHDAKTRAPRSRPLPMTLTDPTMTTIFNYFLFED